MKLVWWLAAIALVLGCSDRDRGSTAARDPQPPRRVIEPPMGTVRPLPPHAIRADGVGPYKLGDKLASVLQYLPSGPRIARIEMPGVVRSSLIRAEGDTVLIGGEIAGSATYVAVVGPEVAFTEAGVHVGSSLDELTTALGPRADDLERARDPRLAVPSKLRNARAVLDGDRIIAIVVIAEPNKPRPAETTTCERPAATERAFGACLSGGELVELAGGEIVVRTADGKRTFPPLPAANVIWAAALRNVDGRDELVLVSRVDDGQQRSWWITAYRLDGGRITRAVDPERLYQLSRAETRWIGAELRDVDLYLELVSRADGIEVGGLLTTHANAKVRDVAVISPILVGRRHGKSAPTEATDAGVPSREDDATTQLDALAGAGSANP